MPQKTALTTLQQQEIIAMRMQGASNKAIANKLKLHHVTVCRVYRAFLKASVPIAEDLTNWRSDLRGLAIKALRRGLADTTDSAKAGNLGVATLRGLGEFENENQVHIAALIATVPEAHRDRYLSLDGADGDVIESGDGTQTAGENEK
jgi:hypothetical protein